MSCTEKCWTPARCPHDREMTPLGRSVPLGAYVPCDCYRDVSLNKRHLWSIHDDTRSYSDPEGWAAHAAFCEQCRAEAS